MLASSCGVAGPGQWEGAARAQVAKREWMESVRLVFDYFCERTPRSFVESRESSVVWNYKYADVEFGRLQVRVRAACGSAVSAVHLWQGVADLKRDRRYSLQLHWHTMVCSAPHC